MLPGPHVLDSGYVDAALLAHALQEYGRLVKTLFILRYLESQDYRRRINAQLNKGESLHALRDSLFVADKGVIRRKQKEAQTNQAMCLNLITNAVVVWNTVYMQAVLDHLGTEGGVPVTGVQKPTIRTSTVKGEEENDRYIPQYTWSKRAEMFPCWSGCLWTSS